MEGNDLGQGFGNRFVVILEPTVVSLSDGKGTTGKRLRDYVRLSTDWDKKAAEYVVNDKMIMWMNWFARNHNVSIKVWSFLRLELFERLMLPVDRLVGDYVTEWARWESEHEAYLALRMDPSILAVYDSDMDRVERLWQFRGSVVQEGAAP